MQSLLLLGVAVAVTGASLLGISLYKTFKRRWLSGLGVGVSGCFVLLVAAIVLLLVANLRTYQRLVYESPVAEITFREISPEKYSVELIETDIGRRRTFELLGDEWQLDAQILTWSGFATVIGLDAQYRLSRLSGRYTDIFLEKNAQRSVHELTSSSRLDAWSMVQKYKNWISWADATYGSAVYLPMVDEARFKISISRTGLLARPENLPARKAVTNWIGI